MTSEAWESWRTKFRSDLKDELKRRGMKYRDLAEALGYADSSSVSYHITGKGPSIEFVEKVSSLWPARFGRAPMELLTLQAGAPPAETLSHLHRDEILVALQALEQAFSVLRGAVERYVAGGPDDETPRPASTGRDCDSH